MRGEGLATVSRELVTAATLTGWHDTLLVAGETALTTRTAMGEKLESGWLKAKLGSALLHVLHVLAIPRREFAELLGIARAGSSLRSH